MFQGVSDSDDDAPTRSTGYALASVMGKMSFLWNRLLQSDEQRCVLCLHVSAEEWSVSHVG